MNLHKLTQRLLAIFILLTFYTFKISAQNTVYVNDERIPQKTLNFLASYYNISIIDGSYWYDNFNGTWGLIGGPTMGIALPFMNLGGRLKAQASKGKTQVFVNGRELHYQDVVALKKIIDVRPGRYWLDAKGNGGYLGQAATFNLYYLAKKANNSSFFRNSYTGIGGGSSGGTSYVIGKDFSVIIGN